MRRLELLRPVLRRLVRNPEGVVLAILTLALGIGASTAMFTVVHGVLLQPLPYPESDRLAGVWHTGTGAFFDELKQSEGSYLTYRTHARTVEEIAVVREETVALSGAGAPDRIPVALATPSLLRVLGIEPVVGRGFTEEEGLPGAEPVALLTSGLWSRRFGSDPDVLGRRIDIDGVAHTVVGVLPPGIAFPAPEVEAWLPLTIDPARADTGNFSLYGVARLRAGVDPARVERELDALVTRIPEEHPEGGVTAQDLERVGLSAWVRPLRDDVVGEAGQVLWPLFGGFGIIFLIACGNVANLFLVRAEGRRRETAVRAALGAGRWRTAGELLAEALLLALLAGAAGVVLATIGVEALKAFAPERVPRLEEIGVGPPALAFAAGASGLSALLLGTLPALRSAASDPAGWLAGGARRRSTGRRWPGAADLLVAGQVGLALVLLAGSGLMVRSHAALSAVDPGFRARDVLSFRLVLPESRYGEPALRADRIREILERLEAVPGVEEAAATSELPLGGRLSVFGHRPEGLELRPDQPPPMLAAFQVTPRLFETLGIPLRAGRGLEDADAEDLRRVAVVNRAAAERLWPGQSAVGRRLTSSLRDEDARWFEVVGVVGDVRARALQWEPEMAVYYPLARPGAEGAVVPEGVWVVLRTAVPPLSVAPAVRGAVWELDPELPVADVRSMEQVVARATARSRFLLLLLLAGAVVGVVLGAVGLYGVVSYAVVQRTREIGVRMAVGARRGQVRAMVLRRSGAVAVAGSALGLVGAAMATRALEAVLYGVAPGDPLTLAGAAALLLAATLAAADAPARRAAAVDPVVCLGAEERGAGRRGRGRAAGSRTGNAMRGGRPSSPALGLRLTPPAPG